MTATAFLRSTSRRPLAAGWLIAPLPLLIVAALALPLAGVVGWSVTRPSPGLQNYLGLWELRDLLWRTLRICGLTTLIAVTAAYLIAWSWVTASPRRRVAIELFVLLPFWISVLIRAFAWLVILRNDGPINGFLLATGAIDTPLRLVRNEFGVIVGMVHYMIPYAVFPLITVLKGIDPRLQLAARSLGARPLQRFLHVTLPLSLPGVVGAATIVFVFCLGFFVTPAILGGGRAVMVAEFVYLQIFQTTNWGAGAAMAVFLIAVVALLLLALRRLVALGLGSPAR